jgi:broad specificity phosphatase PhoE
LIERELYIIRHGQTDHNARGIIQGKGVDLSLNSKGRQQAMAFFKAYKHVPFDMLYSSSLKRAQETIEPFKQLGIPHQSFKELDEISWGEYEGTVATNQSDVVFQSLVNRWRSGDIHAKPSPTGESPFDLQQRQQSFINNLLATKYKKILIATHGRFIRVFMCTLTGKPLSEMENFPHSNLCLYKVNLMSNGKFEIEMSCDSEHLGQNKA